MKVRKIFAKSFGNKKVRRRRRRKFVNIKLNVTNGTLSIFDPFRLLDVKITNFIIIFIH